MTTTIWLVLLTIGVIGDLGVMAFDKIRGRWRRLNADIDTLRQADPAAGSNHGVVIVPPTWRPFPVPHVDVPPMPHVQVPPLPRPRTQFDRHVDQAIEQTR